MYIVFSTPGSAMGKRFDSHEAEAMGRCIMDELAKGRAARVALFC